jgi:DNA-binding MarR family transcriptional regulator
MTSTKGTRPAKTARAARRHNADGTIRELLSYRMHKVASLISRSAALQYRRHFDVSLGEWRALALLGAGAGLSMNELARAADLDKAQMSRVISALSDRGLVARDESATRGQTVKLMLTRRGETLYHRLIVAATERNNAFLACLTAQEHASLDAALTKLAAVARALINAESGAAARSRPLARKVNGKPVSVDNVNR